MATVPAIAPDETADLLRREAYEVLEDKSSAYLHKREAAMMLGMASIIELLLGQ